MEWQHELFCMGLFKAPKQKSVRCHFFCSGPSSINSAQQLLAGFWWQTYILSGTVWQFLVGLADRPSPGQLALLAKNCGRLGEDESKQERNLPRQGRTTGIPRISTGLQNFGRVRNIGGATSSLDFNMQYIQGHLNCSAPPIAQSRNQQRHLYC